MSITSLNSNVADCQFDRFSLEQMNATQPVMDHRGDDLRLKERRNAVTATLIACDDEVTWARKFGTAADKAHFHMNLTACNRCVEKLDELDAELADISADGFYLTGELVDSALFNHENRTMLEIENFVDFLPPVKAIKDAAYQKIANERLADTVVQGYGDAWEGLGAHTADMPQLDRMVFEDCYDGSGAVQRASLNVPKLHGSRKPEFLAAYFEKNELACTFDEAQALIDAWEIIDSSGKSWPDLKKWVVANGTVEQAVTYFEFLADQMERAVDAKPATDLVINDHGHVEFFAPDIDLGYDEDYDYGHDVPMADWVLEQLEAEKEAEIHRYVTIEGNVHEERAFVPPPEFAYQNMNFDGSLYDPTLWRAQPRAKEFRELMGRLRTAKYNQLKTLAVEVHNGPRWMNWLQASTFWTDYRLRKKLLERRIAEYVTGLLANLTKVEQKSLTMIRNTKSVKQAKFYWHLIYSACEGKRDMGRRGFVEYVLKPELDKRQRELKAGVAVSNPADTMDVGGYMDALMADIEA